MCVCACVFTVQLVGQYDIVVNCTGFGSHQLLNDSNLIPNRGHLIKVHLSISRYLFNYEEDKPSDCMGSFALPDIQTVSFYASTNSGGID